MYYHESYKKYGMPGWWRALPSRHKISTGHTWQPWTQRNRCSCFYRRYRKAKGRLRGGCCWKTWKTSSLRWRPPQNTLRNYNRSCEEIRCWCGHGSEWWTYSGLLKEVQDCITCSWHGSALRRPWFQVLPTFRAWCAEKTIPQDPWNWKKDRENRSICIRSQTHTQRELQPLCGCNGTWRSWRTWNSSRWQDRNNTRVPNGTVR